MLYNLDVKWYELTTSHLANDFAAASGTPASALWLIRLDSKTSELVWLITSVTQSYKI